MVLLTIHTYMVWLFCFFLSTYIGFMGVEETRWLFKQIMLEIVHVAQAQRIDLRVLRRKKKPCAILLSALCSLYV